MILMSFRVQDFFRFGYAQSFGSGLMSFEFHRLELAHLANKAKIKVMIYFR